MPQLAQRPVVNIKFTDNLSLTVDLNTIHKIQNTVISIAGNSKQVKYSLQNLKHCNTFAGILKQGNYIQKIQNTAIRWQGTQSRTNAIHKIQNTVVSWLTTKGSFKQCFAVRALIIDGKSLMFQLWFISTISRKKQGEDTPEIFFT